MDKTYDLVITNGSVALTSKNGSIRWENIDLGIANGKIIKIAHNLEGKDTFDAKGLKVLPGLIDSQVHLRDPGLTHKEDLEHGSLSAIKGGIVAFFEMPNTKPNTASKARLDEKLQIAKQKTYCDHAFFIGATGSNTHLLADLEKEHGCAGVKIFMGSSTGDLLVAEDEKLLKILQNGQRRVAIHCEDEARLKQRKYIAIEAAHPRAHTIWRDVESALNATKRIVSLSKKAKRNIHVLHITTAEELDFLKDNKTYCSVECLPQHLSLSSPECYERLGSLAQMNPPIREKRHQDALWKAINSGIIDILGSDHAPHTKEEKAQTYPQSPSGMTGVQTIVPLMLNHVNEGRLSLDKLIQLMSFNLCKTHGLKNKGRIAVGYDADFTIVDMKQTKTITNDWIASKSKWTPYDGMTVTGWPKATIVRGQVVMQEDEVLGKAGYGEAVTFETSL